MNLRAALFRALSDLKKNGILGREAILRKSVLDDCKGDRFDEILAGFSNAVVRKVLDALGESDANPARRLSTSKALTPEEYHTVMVPLIISHRVSLASMGERRARVRATHDEFSQLLDSKKTELAGRSNGGSFKSDGPSNADQVSRVVRSNWLGSEEWADALLYAGSRSSTDGFLELPFSKAWSAANQHTVESLSNAPPQDILVDLESRVSRQRSRLHKWREFRDSMQKKDDSTHANQAKNANCSSFTFRDHQSLTVASIARTVRSPASRTDLRSEDTSLLSSVNDAFAQIDGKPLSPKPMPQKPAVTIGTVEQEPLVPSTEPPYIEGTGDDEKHESTITINAIPEITTEPDSVTDNEDNEDNGDDEENTPKQAAPRHQTETQTLAERTRKSMSLVPPSTTPNNLKRGMANTNHPSRKRNHNHHHRHRQSFPVNQFGTPRKQQQQQQQQSRATTPHDELLSETADYASVFKSRPRIAQSPISSPAVHVGFDDKFDLDGESEYEYEYEYENENENETPSGGRYLEGVEDSPLFSRGRIRY